MVGRIERIELWHVNVPLPEPFWPSWIPGYPQTHVAQTYARFVTSDGLTGETAGPAFTTERRGLGDLLGGFLLGMAADDLDGFRFLYGTEEVVDPGGDPDPDPDPGTDPDPDPTPDPTSDPTPEPTVPTPTPTPSPSGPVATPSDPAPSPTEPAS